MFILKVGHIANVNQHAADAEFVKPLHSCVDPGPIHAAPRFERWDELERPGAPEVLTRGAFVHGRQIWKYSR